MRLTDATSTTDGVGDRHTEHLPRGLHLQWHITQRCNFHCRHCYQEGAAGPDPNMDNLLTVLAGYRGLLAAVRQRRPGIRGHVTVTGGEPLFHPNFLHLLETVAGAGDCISFAVLTNGSLVDEAVARRLRNLGTAYVQVSVEGTRSTHEAIRGQGSYSQVVEGIGHLTRAGLRVLISFTAHRANFLEFPEVVKLGRQMGVARVWADRLIPCGRGLDLKEQALTLDETREFVALMRQVRDARGHLWPLGNRTEVSLHRALQFLAGGGRPYRCAAGDRLLTVMPNGDVYPCRRMPIRVGNVYETGLTELYTGNALLRSLRDPIRVSHGCEGCFYSRLCGGGLRCLAFAVAGDPFTRDPGCWRAMPADHPAPALCR